MQNLIMHFKFTSFIGSFKIHMKFIIS
jgi:hypothetical protein